MALLKLDKERRPRVLLVPPPDLPVPAVQGGAVETLLTHLIRENEKQADAPNLSAAFALAACDFSAAGRRELLGCRLVFLGGLMLHKTTLFSTCYIQFTKKRQIVKK